MDISNKLSVGKVMLNMTKLTTLSVKDQERFYQQVIEYSIEPTILHLNHEILYINTAGEKFLEGTKEMIIGTQILDTLANEAKPIIRKRIEKIIKTNESAEPIDQEVRKNDGSKVLVQLSCHPIMYGNRVIVQTFFRDISKRRDVENMNKQLIKSINELSFPIVPIVKGISVLPLIGAIDRNRAEQLLQNVPMQIKGADLEYLIIDFSGIYKFDTIIVEYLLKLHNVTKLLGVQTIVTGIRPDLASVSTRLNHDLRFMKTETTVMGALRSLGIKSKVDLV